MELRYSSERNIPKNVNEDTRAIPQQLDSTVFITNL